MPQNILATSASLGYVSGVAVYAGNIYVSLQAYAAVIKVDPSGNLTLVAGAGTPGFSGDGGPSASAKLNNPQGLAVNPSNGDLYIADAGNNRIRKVSGGIITTLLGGGAISLANPHGVAVDNAGNIYIADTGNNVVRKWSNGAVTTVAGTGAGGFNNYSGSATATDLFGPRSVAVDAFGNLYIADFNNDLIRKVTAGALTSVLDVLGPMAVAVDATGNVFVASSGSDVIGELATTGLISVFAGNQTLGYIGDGGVATGAELNTPAGLAIDPSGNVFIADFNNFVVREVTGGIIYTVAGSIQGFDGDNGSPLSALLLKPIGTAIGPSGELYIVDTNHNRVRKVLNGVITTVAGTGAPGFSGDNGPATSAQLNSPWGVAVDSSGDLFISDLGNSAVRFVNASTGNINTVAGVGGTAGYNADSIVANTALLNAPAGIALDSSKNLYIADFGNHRIREVAQATGMITTVAGTGTEGYNGDGVAATAAQLFNPVDVKLDASGNLYIADHGNNLIRKVSGGTISTIAGLTSHAGTSGAGGFSGDGGPATSALLNAPFGVAFDSNGDLFIADSNNNVIREVSGGVIETIAGNTTAGYSGDLGPPTGASLNSPLAVTVSSAGIIYISDSGNNLIRAVSSSSGLVCTALVTPLSVQAGASGGSFSLAVQTPSSCAWTVANLPSWITAPNGAAGTGPGSASLLIAPDPGATRSATISVAGVSVAVNQAACSYAISPGGQIFPAVGGTGTITVTTGAACAWTVANPNAWITFTGTGGTGSGTLTFTVGSATTATSGRSGTFTVAGLTFTVDQQAGSITGLSPIGSMPHLAAQENWTATFTLVNNTNASNQARLSLFGSNLDATGSGNPLPLSLTFPQESGAPSLLGASADNTLSPYASWIVGTAPATTAPVQTGSAQVLGTGALGGFAIFHRISDNQEAVVPLTPGTPSAPSYLLAFDNTGGIVTAVAVANVATQAASIPYTIRDDTGAKIASGSLALPASGQTSFDLPDPALGFPVTAGKRGTVEFDTPAGGEIGVLGIRNTPQVTASGTVTTLTTVPALANVGTGGGSFAFLASGGDGWQTTFALVNTSGAAAPVTLNFLDPKGNPLPLPISFPQAGAAVSTASSVTQTLAGGATLLIQSTGAPTLLTGSAQLTTTGNVSGFVIFRHNGQEAVVPMENRNAPAYVLAFDNTAGTATGVAINNVSAGSQPVNIPVVIRDDQGNQLATDTLSVAANGDLSFTLVKDKYPQTANVRGTIEFDAPAAVQIGVIGIRTPAALTYTSLPALVK